MIYIARIQRILARTISMGCILGSCCIAVDASAQTRAAIVRDADNPALAPVSLSATLSVPGQGAAGTTANTTLATVPAGKRFVVQYVSYSTYVPDAQHAVNGAYLYSGAFVYKLFIPTAIPHGIYTNGYYFQDGAFPATAYFEAGDDVKLQVSVNPGTSAIYYITVTGYYVTP